MSDESSGDRSPLAVSPQRSRITNGTALLPGVDGRSAWVRRCRDLIELHLSDLGGAERVSEAERSIVRRIAVIEVELERLEAKFAVEPAGVTALDLYQRMANSLRRMLESVGLQRRAVETVPDLSKYLEAKAVQAAPAAADVPARPVRATQARKLAPAAAAPVVPQQPPLPPPPPYTPPAAGEGGR